MTSSGLTGGRNTLRHRFPSHLSSSSPILGRASASHSFFYIINEYSKHVDVLEEVERLGKDRDRQSMVGAINSHTEASQEDESCCWPNHALPLPWLCLFFCIHLPTNLIYLSSG
uniref:Uncharacterized protein n=1 Tax=Kalanchoe fedtschenkoi TaxID=63787 RepID=A0A7N0UVD6_KALFE